MAPNHGPLIVMFVLSLLFFYTELSCADPSNNVIECSAASPYKVNDRSNCSCRSGYDYVHGDTIRTCLAASDTTFWTGTPLLCQMATSGGTAAPLACSSSPCNNGTCLDLYDGGYLCTCNAGFAGTNCETGIMAHFVS